MFHNRISDYRLPEDVAGAGHAAPQATMALVPQQPASQLPDIYAMAWTLAVRDHELDKLFNGDFYEI